MALVGCPFCRELFAEGEAQACPVCGVPLAPVAKLPLSYEARVAMAAELSQVPPEDRQVPWTYLLAEALPAWLLVAIPIAGTVGGILSGSDSRALAICNANRVLRRHNRHRQRGVVFPRQPRLPQ